MKKESRTAFTSWRLAAPTATKMPGDDHKALFKAFQERNASDAERLVDAVVAAGDVDAVDADTGRAALEEAALSDMFAGVTSKLLAAGAKTTTSAGHAKALLCAIEAGAADSALLLIPATKAAGALDSKFKRPDGEFTALMTAESLLSDPERADQKAAYEKIIAALKTASA